jgi:hypothetical protein
VADAEGTIWRMDFSKPDPETWKPEIFFDPYGVDDTLNVGSPTAANMKLMSSESVYPISISINGKNGTTVINGATGSGADVSVNKNNIVYSISESFESASGSTTGKMRAKLNWSQKLVGRHVTGGVNVYSGNLIYTTYDAPKAGALGVSTGCDSDTRPRFYARDFVTAKDSLFPKSDGKFTNPFPAGTLTSNNSGEFFTLTDTTKRGVLPGLLLAANQCSETTSTNVDDPITGNQLFLTKTTRSTTMSLYSSQGSANTSSSTPNPVRQSTNLSQPAAYSESWVPFAE